MNEVGPFLRKDVAMRFACMVKDLTKYKLGEKCGLEE